MVTDTENIILIGMPGVGKSTVGVLLAKQLGLDFIDTDIVIQSAEGQTLAQIIAQQGISGFLQIEATHLLWLKPQKSCDRHRWQRCLQPHRHGPSGPKRNRCFSGSLLATIASAAE